MIAQSFRLLMDDVSGIAVVENFFVPIVRPINQPTHDAPPSCLTMKVITGNFLADNLAATVPMLRVNFHVGLNGHGFRHRNMCGPSG